MSLSRTLMLVVLVCAGCSRPAPTGAPPQVARLIETYESAPVTNPPASIWRYSYRGEVVYYVPPTCCDVQSILYTESGEEICHPDGGLTGRGDGKCPDFFETRADEELVWRDAR